MAGNNLFVGGNSLNSTFLGIISGAGATSTLTKSGSGTLTLSGANTYAGITNVVVGALNIQNAAGLGTSALGTTVSAGAALELQSVAGMAIGAEALTLNGTGLANGGALRNISGTNSYNGAIIIGSVTQINADLDFLFLYGTISGAGQNLTFGGAGEVDVYGTITTGTGSLTKIGSATLALSGNNTYTGVTTVNAGTLQLFNGEAIANTGAVLVNAPGSLQVFASETIGSLAGSGSVGLSSAVILTVGGTNTNTAYSGVISELGGIGSLTKIGAGTQTLSGANTYTGATTISDGVLQLTGGAAISDTGAVIVNTPGLLQVFTSETIGSLAGSGNVQLNWAAGNLTLGGANTSTAFSGAISESGSFGNLIIIGTGKQTFSGANTFTGATTISAGVLNIQNNTGLGTTAGGTSVAQFAALELQGGITIGAEALTLNGSGVSNGGALRNI